MEKHHESYKDFVGGLAKQINADYILEIGLGTGLTASICLDYIEYRQKGKYVVLDFAPRQEGLDVLNKYDKKFWELRIGDTSKDDGVFQNCHDNRFDLLLIDGGHNFEHPINDVRKLILYGCAKSDSLWVFHDTIGSHLRQSAIECARMFHMEIFDIPYANLTLGKFSNGIRIN